MGRGGGRADLATNNPNGDIDPQMGDSVNALNLMFNVVSYILMFYLKLCVLR